MRSAFFVVAAVIFGDIAHAATPAERITATHYPSYTISKDAGSFKVNVSIVVKSPATDDDPGLADFSIKVRFPDGSEVGQDCSDEEYAYENSTMLFAPFDGEASCTLDFINAMNDQFSAVMGATEKTVKAPIALGYSAETNSLSFNAIGGIRVVIPAGSPVPKGRLL